MRKTVSLLLGIILLVTMLVMTGCAKQITVAFTVEGFDADTVVSAAAINEIGNCTRVQDADHVEPTFTITVKGDGDYSLMLVAMNGDTCPFTLKVHNGKVEVETPKGVTVNPTIK